MEKTLIIPKVGDVVEVYFSHMEDSFNKYKPEEIRFTSTVVKVRERLGKINYGKDNQNPLIYLENGQMCDSSYVTEIVMHRRILQPKDNIFKEEVENIKDLSIVNNKKTIEGRLYRICQYNLSLLDENILTEISQDKLRCYSKSLTGVSFRYKSIITVKKDHFKKWFKKNWKSILYTKKEYSKILTDINTRMDKEMVNDLLNDLIDDMDRRDA